MISYFIFSPGAHFLQLLVSKFDKIMKTPSDVEDKTLDNLVIALAQMYNFKVFDSKLMHEILNELAKEFTEKNVDCILHVLKNVGFVLRKDDPLALKNFILDSNKKAASVTSNAVNGYVENWINFCQLLISIIFSQNENEIFTGCVNCH